MGIFLCMSTFSNSSDNRAAMMICILFIYLLYHCCYVLHIFLKTDMAIQLKKFASEITSVYACGIIFILMATFLFPHAFMTVMGYFFFVSLGAIAAGYALSKDQIKIIGAMAAALICFIMGLGPVSYTHLTLPTNREV
eukprot:TRINITY_DN1849_c0_g1_i12.p1 TRINITY_DN1849_c0_g1~~TRINITY_DN1849_c0_g1_i12.p1  ORF type:complete len:138 (-),score=41.91 TRINITY_DN1849_c0_g1_i12:43-456(-)